MTRLGRAVNTRRRAPSNSVSIRELACSAPVSLEPLRSLWGTDMRTLPRTSGAKLSVSAAVPRGLALLADASGEALRLIPASGTGSASPWRPRVSPMRNGDDYTAAGDRVDFLT